MAHRKYIKIVNLSTGEEFDNITQASLTVGHRNGLKDAIDRRHLGYRVGTFRLKYKECVWEITANAPNNKDPSVTHIQDASEILNVFHSVKPKRLPLSERIIKAAAIAKVSPFVVALILKENATVKVSESLKEQMFRLSQRTMRRKRSA